MQRFERHISSNDPILTTILNYYEFARGLSVSINPAVSIIKKYFRNIIKIEPISYKIQESGSDIYKQLKSRHKSKHCPDDVDILTASFAIYVKGILITHDSDFNKISALKNFQIENWELQQVLYYRPYCFPTDQDQLISYSIILVEINIILSTTISSLVSFLLFYNDRLFYLPDYRLVLMLHSN